MKRRVINLIKDKKGFATLHNIMITIIILMLVGVGVYAFYGYTSSSYSVKAGNTAKKVFDAVQYSIGDITRRNLLEEFNESAAGFGGVVDIQKYRPALQSVYKGEDFDKFFRGFEERYVEMPIRYLLLDSSKTYKGDRKKNPIMQMLDLEIPDANIMKNAFLIEYNSDTGEVIAVFYSEKTDTFTYEGETKQKSNVILRDSKSLRSKWQGYYGLNVEDL